MDLGVTIRLMGESAHRETLATCARLAEDAGFAALLFHGTGLGPLPLSDPESDSLENTRLRVMLEDHIAQGGVVVVVAGIVVVTPATVSLRPLLASRRSRSAS